MNHAVTIDSEELQKQRLPDELGRLSTPALGAGIVLLVVMAVLGVASGQEGGLRSFLFSYLTCFCYVLSIALGALFFVAFQHVTRAGWSVVVRRPAEVIASTLMVIGFLFVPILASVVLGSGELYEWNATKLRDPSLEGALAGKKAYLNVVFFLIRCVIYFGVWFYLSNMYLQTSLEQDETGSKQLSLDMEQRSTWGLFLLAGTVTFAAVDFIMSLDFMWYSTIFGVYYFATSLVSGFSALTIMVYILQQRGLFKEMVTKEHYHDLGKLMFAFNCFWAYIAFSQYFLIWYANIPEETAWILVRQENGWMAVSLVLAIGHFVIPFLGLMSRGMKRNPHTLFLWAVYMLAMGFVDIYWLVMPQFNAGSETYAGPTFGLMGVLGLIGMLCVFVGLVLRSAKETVLIPQKDPRMSESLAFHNI